MSEVTSKHGIRIALTTLGSGSPVVLINGALAAGFGYFIYGKGKTI